MAVADICPVQFSTYLELTKIQFKTINVKSFKARIMLLNRIFAKLHESLFRNTGSVFNAEVLTKYSCLASKTT